MKSLYGRRNFIKTSAVAGSGLGISGSILPLFGKGFSSVAGKRVGIIGLDTSHSVEFTKELNSAGTSSEFDGYRVVAAYPRGSLDIEWMRKMGISSIMKRLRNTGKGNMNLAGNQRYDVIKAELNEFKT